MPPVKIKGVQRPENTKRTIRTLLSYMGGHKFLWPLVILCVLLSAGAEVAGTLLIRPIVNNYIVPLKKKKNPPSADFLVMIKSNLLHFHQSSQKIPTHNFLSSFRLVPFIFTKYIFIY